MLYIKVLDEIRSEVLFVFGKVKLVFLYGYLMLRLEFCVVFMVVEIVEIVKRYLNIIFVNIWFYFDSKIVLGYISNYIKCVYNEIVIGKIM